MTSADTTGYVYFVSYHFANQHGPGFGSMTLTTAERVTSGTGTNELADHIRQSQGFASVVLLNIQLLNGPDAQ